MAKYWVGGSGTWNNNSGGRWSYYSGGPGGYGNPSSGEDAIFDGNSGGGTVNVATGRQCYNLLLNGFTGTFTGARSTQLPIYGTSITLTGSSGVSMPGNGPKLVLYNNATLNTYGSTIGDITIINGYSLTLASNVASKNNTVIVNNASSTVNANGYNMTVGYYYCAGTTTMGSGMWQALQAGPLSGPEYCWQKVGGSLSASSSTLRFVRARASGCLSSSISDSSTSLTLVDAYLDNNQTAWPSSGTIQIDNEIISYSSTSGGSQNVTLSGLTRHLYDTAPASHGSGAVVLLLGLMQTTLTSAANSGDGTIYVSDTTNFQGNGYLEVGGEIIYYGAKTSTYFYSLSRGQTSYGGTSAAYHASGTVVRQAEYRYMNLDYYNNGFTYNNVEFGTNGAYLMSYIFGYVTATNLRAGPYLPANPLPMQYINFQNSQSITNFLLQGRRGTQGIQSQPVYVKGRTGTETSTVNYISYAYGYPAPSKMPYTYTGGDPWDFESF